MKVRNIIASVLLVTAATAGAVAQASPSEGSDPNARAKFVSKIKTQADGEKATLRASYRCSEGESLWVSAKQTATGEKDKALKDEGSSEVAASWLQSHRNKFTCDGKKRTAKFAIDLKEPGSKGALVEGEAWVQFYVIAGDELILSKTGWVTVR